MIIGEYLIWIFIFLWGGFFFFLFRILSLFYEINMYIKNYDILFMYMFNLYKKFDINY